MERAMRGRARCWLHDSAASTRNTRHRLELLAAARLNGLEPRRQAATVAWLCPPSHKAPVLAAGRRESEEPVFRSRTVRRCVAGAVWSSLQSWLLHGAAFKGKEGAVLVILVVHHPAQQPLKPSPLAGGWEGVCRRAMMVSDPRVSRGRKEGGGGGCGCVREVEPCTVPGWRTTTTGCKATNNQTAAAEH